MPTTGLRVHYREWGCPKVNGDSATAVLLLHGLASTCRIFDLSGALASKQRRIVAYDQRGHGRTAKPRSGYDFRTLVCDGIGVVRMMSHRDATIVRIQALQPALRVVRLDDTIHDVPLQRPALLAEAIVAA